MWPGVVYELSQGEHRCTWDPDYPEHPGRLLSVLARYDDHGDYGDHEVDAGRHDVPGPGLSVHGVQFFLPLPLLR